MSDKNKTTGLFYALAAVFLLSFSVPVQAEETSVKFPDYFERESGNVSYGCEVILPEGFDAEGLYRGKVEGVYCSDYQSALDLLANGRTVLEETVYPAEGDIPEWRYYTFEDGAVLLTGDTTSFSAADSLYYEGAFRRLSDGAPEQEPDAGFDFLPASECRNNLADLLHNLGLGSEVSLTSYALDYVQASEWEEHLGQDGSDAQEQYKQEWSEQDNAYLIYGYQIFQNLPVYHELMFLGGNMKYFNADNALIQAVYTREGILRLQANYLYMLVPTEEKITLAPFEKIADTVDVRLNGVIGDTQFEVTTAVLMQMVRHNQNQTYDVFPIWYVEAESQTGTTSVLVNAETAEEIFVR